MIRRDVHPGGREYRPHSEASHIPANKSISLHALLMYYSYRELLPVIKKPLESLN